MTLRKDEPHTTATGATEVPARSKQSSSEGLYQTFYLTGTPLLPREIRHFVKASVLKRRLAGSFKSPFKNCSSEYAVIRWLQHASESAFWIMEKDCNIPPGYSP